jgi:hypothetical protein
MEEIERAGFGQRKHFTLAEPKLASVRAQLEREFSDITARRPEEFDLSEAWAALLAAKRRANDLWSLNRKTLRHAPWVIFDVREGLSPLAGDKRFAEAYLKRLMHNGSAAAVINLAQGFLYAYPTQLLTFDLFASALPRLLERCQTGRCKRLLDHVARHRLLKPEGPATVWGYLANEFDSVAEMLERIGIGETLQRGGFGNAVFEEAMAATRRVLTRDASSTENTVTRLFDLAKDPTGASGKFRFPRHRVALVESLVLPLAQGAQGEPVRELIETFVLDHYGDPRVDRSQWQGVSEDAIRVVSGWLVAETLGDFFRLIEHTARSDFTARRHWRYRKAFWSAYLRAGVISDAWIVLANHIDDDAQQTLEMDRKAYGRFRRGAGVQANHAALILRIGDLLITDWSHSGKYRAWESGGRSRETPKLYRSAYTRFDLTRGADYEGTHHGTETGTWQRALAEYIRFRTGIRLDPRVMMPT